MTFKDGFKFIEHLTESEMDFISFKRLNELLPAILNSLNPKDSDNILSICGSGDQPIAFLEYANSVVAVDHQEDQIQFAYQRLELIKEGKFNDFRYFGLKSDEMDALVKLRNLYFTDERLTKISSKLDNLSFVNRDIFFLDNKFYDKDIIYLSNAYSKGKLQPFYDLIEQTKPGTRIYITRPHRLFDFELVNVDNSASMIAREIEGGNPKHYTWNPTICVKK